MKNFLIVCSLLLSSHFIWAQSNNNVGIGTITPNPSAILHLQDPNKALLLTVVNNISNILTPSAGMIIFDNTRKCLRYYTGNQWSGCINAPVMNNVTLSFGPINPEGVCPGLGTVYDYVKINTPQPGVTYQYRAISSIPSSDPWIDCTTYISGDVVTGDICCNMTPNYIQVRGIMGSDTSDVIGQTSCGGE